MYKVQTYEICKRYNNFYTKFKVQHCFVTVTTDHSYMYVCSCRFYSPTPEVINLKKFYSDMRIIQRRPSPLSMYSKALLISEKGISWVMNFSSSSSCHIWNNSEEEKSVRKVIHVEISINFQFFHVS